MKNKTLVIIVVLVLIGIGLFFYNTTNTKKESGGVLKIGYIGPETGPSAVLGMDAVVALQIAKEEALAQGKKVELIIEDDRYLTKDTVTAYNKLVNIDNVDIVLVATYGGVFAIAEQAKKDNVVIIDPLDCNSQLASLGDNIFCLATDTETIGVSLANHLIKQGQLKSGVMYSTKDSFMSLVADAFEQEYKKSGGQIIKESFNYEDSDFRTQLTKIKSQNPEALVLLGHDETGLIMKQARELGMNQPFLTTGTITSPSLQEAAKGNAEGTVFAYWEPGSDNKESVDSVNRFTQKAGRPPILPLTTHPAYDTFNILVDEVLPNIKGEMTPEKIKKELLKVKNYKGTTGLVSFDLDGGARIPESVFRLVNGIPEKI